MVTIAFALNLYVAGRVAMVSGRLKRPWPNLASLRFPKYMPAAFAVALLLWFMPGLPGMVGGIVSGTLIIAYALLGAAILHDVTRPLGDRILILSAIYLILLVFWPACILLAMFGICRLDLRLPQNRRRQHAAGHHMTTTTTDISLKE